jgi:hypothetical protein
MTSRHHRLAQWMEAARSIWRALAASRSPVAWLALLTALVVSSVTAHAQSITSVVANPTTYSAAGQTINFTYTFDSGNRRLLSTSAGLTMTSILPGVTINCPVPVGQNSGEIIVCTSSYVTAAGDVFPGAMLT